MSKEKKNMRIPKDYFENSKQKLLNYAKGDQDMVDFKEDAPLLTSLDKQTGFVLPKDYFERLPQKLARNKRSSQSMHGKTRSMFYYAAAASLLCLLGYFGFQANALESNIEESALSLESDEDIEFAYSYLLEELDQFTQEELLYDEAYADFLQEEEDMTDDELETILDDLSDEFSIEDFEDIF